MRFISLVFACLLLPACAITKATKKSNPDLINPATREKAKGHGTITLLEHQLAPHRLFA
jgi:hypothetical protein